MFVAQLVPGAAGAAYRPYPLTPPQPRLHPAREHLRPERLSDIPQAASFFKSCFNKVYANFIYLSIYLSICISKSERQAHELLTQDL